MRKLIAILLLLFLFPAPRQATHSEEKLDISNKLKIKLKRTDGYSWGCSGIDEEEPNQALAIPPLVVPDNRLLVTVCDSLYMLDSSGDVIWHWSTGGAGITAQPVIDSTGTIHVIAADLIWKALDAETGMVKWDNSGSNVKSAYTQMKPYKNAQYLVVVDDSFYRESDPNLPDGLVLYRGKERIAYSDFPAGARLEVWGERILAVSHNKDSVKIQQIKMHKQKPEER